VATLQGKGTTHLGPRQTCRNVSLLRAGCRQDGLGPGSELASRGEAGRRRRTALRFLVAGQQRPSRRRAFAEPPAAPRSDPPRRGFPTPVRGNPSREKAATRRLNGPAPGELGPGTHLATYYSASIRASSGRHPQEGDARAKSPELLEGWFLYFAVAPQLPEATRYASLAKTGFGDSTLNSFVLKTAMVPSSLNAGAPSDV
jgi:hypothetical protein